MSLRKKQSVKRLKAALNKKYESKANTIQAGPLGSNQIYAAGQVYNASLDGVTEVVNIGRPAAAQYVARRGGGTTVVAAGGSSGSGSGVTGDYLRLDGSTIMLGDLNMGSSDIINVGTVDGVDVSAFKATYDAHILDADAHHDQVHDITGSDHTIASAKWGIVGATATNTIGILTPSAAPGAAEAILKSTSSGGLTLPTFTATTSVTTPVVTSSGNLKLDPTGGDVWIDGNVGVGRELPDSLLTVVGAHSNTIAHMHADNNANTDAHLYLWASEPVKTYTGVGISNNWRYSSGWARQETGVGASYIRLLDAKVEIHTVNSSGTDYQSITIDSAGKVGVFDATPSYELDVTGDIRATSSMLTPTVTTVTGDLTLSPADDIMLDPTSNLVKVTSDVSLQADNYASQVSGWRITYDGQADFRYIYTDELHAKAFIADLEQALAGGQIIAKSVTILYSDFTAPAAGGTASLTVRDLPSATGMAVFVDGDYIRIREFSRSGGSLSIADCWGTVVLDTSYGTSGFDSATKTQRYTFTRSASPNAGAMSTGNVVEADAIILDYGTSGNGFYEVNAIDGLYGANSPYSQIVTWSGHPRNQTVQARLGNLYGIWSVTGEYGLYAGEGVTDDDSYLRISNNAVRLNNVPLRLYNSGTQTVNIDSTGTNIWVGPSSADKRLSWNGTTLAIEGDIVITGGSGIASLSDAGSLATADDLDDVADGSTYKRTNANEKTGAGRAYTAINSSNNLVTSVIPASAITPSGAGLYLGSNYMGYYDSSVWKTYIANNGDFKFAGDSGSNYIQWDASANKLQGVGSSVEQWYADATDGKLYAGAGATWLDVDGVNILADSTTTHASQSNANAVTFERSNGTLVGRLTSYYISGTTTYGLDLYARSPNQEATFATFGAEQAGTTYAGGSAGAPRVVASNASGGGDELRLYSSGTIKLFNTGSASPDVTLSSGTLTTGALNSGALSVTGNIAVSGTVDSVDIAAFKSAYDSHTHSYLPLSGGTLTGTLNGRDYIPTADNTYDLGSASNRIAEAHIASLYVDTIVGTPSYSHTHSASDITSGTLDDARLPGTQSGKTFDSSVHIDADAAETTYNYIRWKTDNTADKRWDLIAYDKDHATTALRNDMLLTYYDGSTTYNVLSVDSGTRVLSFNNTPTVGASTIWHAGNDGSGTGLDADLLDGNHASAFALSSHTHAASAITSGTLDLARIPATLTGKTAQYVASTVVAGSGIGVSGSLSSGNVTISHTDTSSQASVNNSGSTFIQDVTLDTYGHVTALASVDAATALSGTFVPVSRTITAGSGLTGGGDLSANRTISHADTSSVVNSGNSGTTVIQSMTFDTYGHVQSVTASDMGSALDSRFVNVTGDTMTGALTVPAIKNALLSVPSQAVLDFSMISYFDRNELVYANNSGSVSVSVTGAYSSISNQQYLVDGTGTYLDISGTDATTTQIVITVDIGYNANSYGRSQWQPFLAYRLYTGMQTTYYNSVSAEVSPDGSTWYSIASWSTSNFASDEHADGVWMGGDGNPSLPGNTWRYARFILMDRVEYSGYSFKDRVWISAVGIRHVSAPFSRIWLDRAGDTMFGDFAIQTGGVNVFDVDVSAALTTVSGDLDVTDDATIDGTLAVSPNIDVVTELGNAKIGWADGTGSATFSHYSRHSSDAFALAQYSDGSTMLNAANGQYIDLAVNGLATATINAERINPRSTVAIDLGDYNRKYRSLFAAELYVETLVAQDVLATIGGRVMVAPTTKLTADVASSDTTIDIEHNNLVSGDYIYLSSARGGTPQIEAMKVTSGPTPLFDGDYRYSVTRNLDGTGANDWDAGDAVVSLGGSVGEGYIDLTSTSTIHSHLGPTMTVYSRTATTNWDDVNAVVSVGNLRSFVDYTADEFGLALGNDLTLTPTTGFSGITADADNGLRLFNVGLATYNSTVQTAALSISGNLKLGTNVSASATTTFDFATSGTLRVGPYAESKPNVFWDGTDLRLRIYDQTYIKLSGSGTASFEGAINLGTSGGIFQGTGTFGSPTTGLKIWNDSGFGKIAGYNAGSVQWQASTDGKLYVGGGAVQMDQGGIKLLDSSTNVARIGNLNGLIDYATTTQGVAVGNNLSLTPTTGFKGVSIDSSSGVRLFSVDIASYSGSTQKVALTASGNMKLGTNTSSAATTSFDFNVSTGALRVGEQAAGSPNLLFDGTDLLLRNNTTAVIKLASSGASTFEQPINLGTGGGIYQGSGSFASPTTGIKIWNDSSIGRIAGYNSGTAQWYAATDGRMYAGAGAVTLDATGVTLLADSTTSHASQNDANAITFERSNGTLVGRLTSYYISAGADYGLDLYSRAPNQEDVFATFGAEQAGTVYGGGSAGAPRVVAYSQSGGGDYLRLYSSGSIELYNSTSATPDLSIVGGEIGLNGNDLVDIGTIGEDWIAVSFGAGWTNFAGYQVCQYKVVGDLVFLRGMAARTSGTGTTILTLPSGARPADDEIFAAYTSTGIGAVSVAPGGAVVHLTGSTTWVSLSGIVLSINS